MRLTTGVEWPQPGSKIMSMYIGDLYTRFNGVSYYTPTFPRGGLSATFGIEVFDLLGASPTLECTVEHKNEDDITFTTAQVFSSMTTPGVTLQDVPGIKEQVRLNITVGGAGPANMVYANVLAPMWRPY